VTTAALSADRLFTTAYNAALQAATAVMYSEGYRSHSLGHHSTAFEFLREAMGAEIVSLAALQEARTFASMARAWIRDRHPEL
jgi:hypothetical protein